MQYCHPIRYYISNPTLFLWSRTVNFNLPETGYFCLFIYFLNYSFIITIIIAIFVVVIVVNIIIVLVLVVIFMVTLVNVFVQLYL